MDSRREKLHRFLILLNGKVLNIINKKENR